MKHIVDKKGFFMGIACMLVLAATWLVYTDLYRELPMFRKKNITIGVFSDSYWGVQNGYSYQILEDAIEMFEQKYPDVQVDYVSGILKEDYSEWLSEQLLSGNAPDVFFVLPEDFNDFAEIGALKDLTPLMDHDEEFHPEKFYSSAYEYGKYREIPYSLPYECAPKLMFVNKTIMDQEGIAIPGETWTWEDFYEICEKVIKDTDGDGIPNQFGVAGYTWKEAFESNGVELFDQRGKECYLTDEKVEPALVFMERLTELSSGYNATAKEFDLGNVVFQPMSFSEYRTYKPYPLSIKKYSDFEWGCIPMPAGPAGENVSTLDTLRVAISANTRNSRYAWEFIKILTCDTGIQSEIFDYSEGVSVLKEVTESEETRRRLMESSVDSSLNLEFLGEAVEHAVVAPGFRNYDEALAEVDKAVNDIMAGSSNIRMEQIIWNRKINKYLEK